MAQVPIIRASDNRSGIIAAVIFTLVILFLLFFIKYTEPDPPKVTIPVPVIMEGDGITDFDVNTGGGGTPNNDAVPVTKPEESPADVPTQEESEVSVPKGTGKTNTNKPSTPTKPAEPANPFGNAGTGGSGIDGTGTGFGSDTGPGTGSGTPGLGVVGDRIRLNGLKSQPKTFNDEETVIQLKVIVDASGRIVYAEAIRSETKTTNQALIDEVVSLAKKEIRYKEKPGAANEVAYIPIRVKPR